MSEPPMRERSMDVFSSLRAFKVSMAVLISVLGAPTALRVRTTLPCASKTACLSAKDLQRESSMAAMVEDDREKANVKLNGIGSTSSQSRGLLLFLSHRPMIWSCREVLMVGESSIPKAAIGLVSSSFLFLGNPKLLNSAGGRVSVVSVNGGRRRNTGFTCNALFGLDVSEIIVISSMTALIFWPKKLGPSKKASFVVWWLRVVRFSEGATGILTVAAEQGGNGEIEGFAHGS
ncbi:hypothetical protein V8G54_008226 [Vigna mungo]|uniref:Uncharacterized protein n=1 Tax=Vigna mungo TaxID=3915 RepID=A0AAQ3S676_VIGMU